MLTAVLPALLLPVSARSETASLPTADSVLERMLERAQQEGADQEMFKQCYSYARTRVTEYRNGDGELKKRKAKTRVNNPALIPAVYHPRPKEEREPVQDTGDNQPMSDTKTNLSGKAFEKSDFPLNGDLLKRFDFTVSGREMVNGRPTLVVDFKPTSPKPPEKSIKDKFINKAAGRVWVDESDYAMAKAKLYLSEKVNVVGGLVGAVSKFTLFIERNRTPEGIWFTQKQNWQLEGREVFVHRKVAYQEEYKDVLKVYEPDMMARLSSIDGEAADD